MIAVSLKTLGIVSILSLFIPLQLVFALEFKDLDENQRKKLENFENITVTFESNEFKNAPWPVVKVFTLIKASPLVAVSIFGALDYQEKYVPKTKKSKPIKEISPTEILTEYEIEVPFPLPNAKHVHGSVLKNLGNESYELSWYRVSSNSTDEARGFARFSSYKNQYTLMEYQTFIIPKSIFASLVKKIMFKDVDNTVTAIKKHTENLLQTKDPLVDKYTKYTQDALSGKSVYGLIIKQEK